MDSTTDDELAGELYDLTRQLRSQILRHAMLGGWAAPGGATARNASASLDPSQAAAGDPSATAPDPSEAVSAGPSQAVASPAGDVRRAPASDAIPMVADDALITLGRRTLPQVRADLGDCTR